MDIRGLKIENDVVFCQKKAEGDWERANTGLIPELERLLRKFEIIDYPNSTKREDIMFEKEFDIGVGRVKSYMDEDGDLVYSFKQENILVDVKLDEDAEFGLTSNSQSHNEKTTDDSRKLKNSWSRQPSIISGENSIISPIESKTLSKVNDKLEPKKDNRRVLDLSSFSPLKLIKAKQVEKSIKKSRLKTIIVKPIIEIPTYQFLKRDFLCKKEHRVFLYLDFMVKNTSKYIDIQYSNPYCPKISFIRKSKINVRKNINIALYFASNTFNHLNNLRPLPDSKFYLEIHTSKKKSIDNILDDIINRKSL